MTENTCRKILCYEAQKVNVKTTCFGPFKVFGFKDASFEPYGIH